jgi:hypothetical protein
MTMSEQRIVIVSFAALTLQLIRLAIDLVQVASKSVIEAAATTTTKETKLDSKTYGSVQKEGTAVSKPTTLDLETANNEDKPLLSVLNAGFTSNDNSHEQYDTTDQQPRSQAIKTMRVYLFVLAWIALAVFFLLYPLLGCSSSSPYCAPAVLLRVTSTCLVLEAYLFCRDVDKDRYGTGKRFLQLTSALTLWIMYVTTTNVEDYHSVLIVTISIVVMLAVLDGWLSRQSPYMQQQRSASKQLSRRAIFVMLKPYFWPDATDDTAVRNRVRAVVTWVCVILSKVCGLYSPLLLGWASTALAHQDYMQTVRYSVSYCVISFLGTTFKEAQSLVYLKVAQAAFIQLSVTAFGHLHSLSLDWHLRKKLGEVLRSMDRGIAACNTLMTYLCLWLVPTCVECLVVCAIFAGYFRYLPLALLVFYFVFAYGLLTILVTLWRKKFRKALTQSDNEYHDIFTDSMVNFETVKFFTAEDFEKERFGDAVKRYQAGSVSVQSSLSLLNISQQFMLKLCLASALSLAVLGIRQRSDCCTATLGCESGLSDCCRDAPYDVCPGMMVGDFVAVLTYTLNL